MADRGGEWKGEGQQTKENRKGEGKEEEMPIKTLLLATGEKGGVEGSGVQGKS